MQYKYEISILITLNKECTADKIMSYSLQFQYQMIHLTARHHFHFKNKFISKVSP